MEDARAATGRGFVTPEKLGISTRESLLPSFPCAPKSWPAGRKLQLTKTGVNCAGEDAGLRCVPGDSVQLSHFFFGRHLLFLTISNCVP